MPRKRFEQFDLTPRPKSRNTVNDIPVDILDGHLPPPGDCPRCGYPVWALYAPDSVAIGGLNPRTFDKPTLVEYTAAFPSCNPLTCGHPYHLIPHTADRLCRHGRVHPTFPDGLLVRPPRTGEVGTPGGYAL